MTVINNTTEFSASDGHAFSAYTAAPEIPSQHHVIVLSEIYGVTDYIKDVCNRFVKAGFCATALQLYDRIKKDLVFDYSETPIAHKTATTKLKIEDAVNDISAVVQAYEGQKISIVGFSYGATLGWIAASQINNISFYCGYYGTRIADYVHMFPKCRYLLYFGTNDIHLTEARKTAIMQAAEDNIIFFPSGHGFDCRDRPEDYVASASSTAFYTTLSRLHEL